MKGITESNKDKNHKVELLSAEEKQAIIKYYYQDPDEMQHPERR